MDLKSTPSFKQPLQRIVWWFFCLQPLTLQASKFKLQYCNPLNFLCLILSLQCQSCPSAKISKHFKVASWQQKRLKRCFHWAAMGPGRGRFCIVAGSWRRSGTWQQNSVKKNIPLKTGSHHKGLKSTWIRFNPILSTKRDASTVPIRWALN